MIDISEKFLKPEVRCDFYISPRMKQTWAAELVIYDEIASICKKYGLRYFAEVGALLGAVRHHGFVPWDDDIDLAMPRADFMEFLKHANELPNGYRVKSIYNDESGTFRQFHAVVENYDRPMLEWDEDRNKRFYGCPFICAVDIYPLDYVPRDNAQNEGITALYNMAYVMAWNYDASHDSDEYKNSLKVLEKKSGYRIDCTGNLRQQIYKIADSIAASTRREDALYMDYYPKLVDGRTGNLREAAWYDGTIEVPFEMTAMPVPVGYDNALKRHFGEYWRFLMHQYTGHGYPFYQDQERLFIMQGHLTPEVPGPGPADAPAEHDEDGRLCMNVASCLNEYYVPYTYVMLSSLFESNHRHSITVYLLHDGLSDEAVKNFDELAAAFNDRAIGGADGKKKIEYIHVTDYSLDPRIHEYGGWNELTMYRLLLWDILPEDVSRVLHLDGDMLILKDLAPLYEQDFEGHDLIACQDILAAKFRRDYCIATHDEEFRELFESGTYFNAGMILMNVKRNRGLHLMDTYEKRAAELNFVLPYPDQDLLNIVHRGRIKYVPTLEYNFPAYDGILLGGYDIDRVKKEVGILHFLDKKPWNDGDHKLYDIEELWWDVAKDTPYADRLKKPLDCVVIRLTENIETLSETVRSIGKELPGYFRSISLTIADTVGNIGGWDPFPEADSSFSYKRIFDISERDYNSVTAVKNDLLTRLDYDRILFIEEGDTLGDIEVLDTSDADRVTEVLLTDGVAVFDRVILTGEMVDNLGLMCEMNFDPEYEYLIRAGVYGFLGKALLWQDSAHQHGIYADTYYMYSYVLKRYSDQAMALGVYEEALTARTDEMEQSGLKAEWDSWMAEKEESRDKYPIAIMRGMKECQGTLDNFAQRLGEKLRKKGRGVIFWDSEALGEERMQRLMFLPYSAVVGFQSRLFSRKLSDGKLLGNLIQGEKFNFLFDHPIYMTEDFKEPVERLHILSQDETYADYVRKRFPHISSVCHFPPAGVETDKTHEKSYDITFIATYNDYRKEMKLIKNLPPNYRRVAGRFLMRQRRFPNERAEDALVRVIDDMGYEPLPDEAFTQALYAMGNVVRCLMYYFRERVVQTLIEDGIEVDVFSRTWEDAPYAHHPLLHIHDEIPHVKSLEVMAKSRLSLNVMSWHKGGMTERIANAMLNHSVVVSDRSTYLCREYGGSDGLGYHVGSASEEDMMLLFDLEDFSDLPERIRGLLSDRDHLEKMAERAYIDAKARHTWDARAEKFLDILSGDVTKRD